MSCITIVRKENLMNLGDRLIEAMGCYGAIMSYEVQTGIIAEPVTVSRGNGHTVVVLYTMYDPDRVVTWVSAADNWYGTESL